MSCNCKHNRKEEEKLLRSGQHSCESHCGCPQPDPHENCSPLKAFGRDIAYTGPKMFFQGIEEGDDYDTVVMKLCKAQSELDKKLNQIIECLNNN